MQRGRVAREEEKELAIEEARAQGRERGRERRWGDALPGGPGRIKAVPRLLPCKHVSEM